MRTKIKRKAVKPGTIIKLFRKYYKHGEPGSAITKDHEVSYDSVGGLELKVYAVDMGWVEYLDGEFRSKILRCRSQDGQHFNVTSRTDTFQIIQT